MSPRDGCVAGNLAGQRVDCASPGLLGLAGGDRGLGNSARPFLGADLPDVDACWLLADEPTPHAAGSP